MTKIQIVIIAAALLLFSCQPVRTEKEQPKPPPRPTQEVKTPVTTAPGRVFIFENSSLTPTTNIHYTGKYCNECHEKTPVKGGKIYLRFNGNYRMLCRCHNGTLSPFHHASGLIPSPGKRKRMPTDFPLKDGKLTCDTCHNIYAMCHLKRPFDRNSLRGGPYEERMKFCFNCHDIKKYEKLNPHHQLNDKGKVITQICLFCHKKKPNVYHDTFKTVKFIGNIGTICSRCHVMEKKHPGNAVHVGVVPPPRILKNMDAMEKKYNVILPLNHKGEMTCVTCHNPHEKGVIPADRPGARGAGSKYRLRLTKFFCKDCHHM